MICQGSVQGRDRDSLGRIVLLCRDQPLRTRLWSTSGGMAVSLPAMSTQSEDACLIFLWALLSCVRGMARC